MAIFTTKDIARERLEVCFSCAYISSSAPHLCTKCGCYMRAKVQLRNATCPINKWGKAPLLKNKISDYTDYWREENDVIASEVSKFPQHGIGHAISTIWPKKNARNDKE